MTPPLTLGYTEINLRYVIGLNLKAKILRFKDSKFESKVSEEGIREYYDLEVGKKMS